MAEFLLYGANGYTGQLIARYAQQYNLQPLLAGRNRAALTALADQLSLPYRVIDLNNTKDLENALNDVKVVIHAAGPFDATAKSMAEACINTNTHYLDINGDINVFEMLKKYDNTAQNAGVMILPGAGFDVVPTDCTALLLKEHLPDATDLKLAFATIGGGISHGTALTMISNLGEGGKRRKAGEIIKVPLGEHGRWIDFGRKKLFAMSIPWGDVSTAHYTTGIPDIETFTGIPINIYRFLKLQSAFNWLLRKDFVRKALKRKIDKRIPGPTDEMRSKAGSLIWGQATNRTGLTKTVTLSAPDGYTLTAHSSLLMVQKILNGHFKAGYQTPASAYGKDFVLEIPGVKREEVY